LTTPPVAAPLDPARRERLPDLPLALLYVGFAHLALLTAWGVLIARPGTLLGFYYHPRAIALTHLITLGWISSSILGALYLIGPIALAARLPRRPIDVVAFASWAVGVCGMVSHFWLGSPGASCGRPGWWSSGRSWSGGGSSRRFAPRRCRPRCGFTSSSPSRTCSSRRSSG
jgi:hypothetical protein